MNKPNLTSAETQFAIDVLSDEMPIRAKAAQRLSATHTAIFQHNKGFILATQNSKEKRSTELELSNLVMDLFSLICVCQVLRIKYKIYISADFAHSLDTLPKFYAALWNAVYQESESNVIAL